MQAKHLFIINPVAGGRDSHHEKLRRSIVEFSQSMSEESEAYVTTEPMDACKKVIQESSKTDNLRVYACGGDGTLSECANGAANRKNVSLSHFPCGTGNDFIKTFGRDNIDYFRDLDALTTGTIRPLDLIDCGERFGINICSVGIDARIGADVHKYSSMPIIGGSFGYVVSLVANVIKGVNRKMKITANNTVHEGKFALVCACNGRFYGGRFNPVPDAMPDDGVLNCILANKISRATVARVVGRYAKGRYKEFPDILIYYPTDKIMIESDEEFVVNVDGESIYSNKISFVNAPKAVNFIFPEKVSFPFATSE